MIKYLAAATLLASGAASAQGLYLIGGIGSADYDVKSSEVQALAQEVVNVGFSTATVSVNKRAGMFKVAAGYQLNPVFSLEGGYTNLGSLDFDIVTTGPSANLGVKLKTDGFEGSLVAKGQLNKDVAIFGRAGMFRWDSKATASAAGISSSATINGRDATYGAGLEFKSWRAEYQRYTLDDQDIDTIQVSYVFKL